MEFHFVMTVQKPHPAGVEIDTHSGIFVTTPAATAVVAGIGVRVWCAPRRRNDHAPAIEAA